MAAERSINKPDLALSYEWVKSGQRLVKKWAFLVLRQAVAFQNSPLLSGQAREDSRGL